MNIADTNTYTIRVSKDIYYIKNKTTGSLIYSLYKQEQTLSLINSITLTGQEEQAITFDGDGIYKVYIGSDIVELRYYLKLQESLITSIGDFLCNCCEVPTMDYDCSCATPIDVKCVQFSSIPLMLLSYQHLVDYCLNSCCAAQYLYDASNEYEYILRESYLGHIQEECIKGKSLYGTKGLRFIASVYYAMFLEAELEARDTDDADYIYNKFDYDRIRGCMEDLGISYDKLKEIMSLCDDKFANIESDLAEIKTTVSNINTTVNNIDESINGSGGGGTSGDNLQDSLDNIYDKTVNIENTVANCCDAPENLHPIADAGADQIVSVSDQVTLDGTDSYDADGTIDTYLWEVISSPVLVTINSPSTASTTVDGFTVEGIYSFSLTVIDNKGATSIDTVTIIVGSAVPTALNSSVVNNRAGACTAAYTFQASDFDFLPSGYTLETIKIVSITSITSGTLEYNSLAITTPLDIAVANIGLLVYTPDDTNTSQHSEPFTFAIKATENASFSNSASMNITNTSCSAAIAQIQLVNDLDANMNCGTVYTIPGVTGGDVATRSFDIDNIGDLALAGVITKSGTSSSKVSLSTSTINVAAGGTQTIDIDITTLESDGGETLTASLILTTNSDINPTCILNLSLAVAEVDAPPTTQINSLTVPRDTTCTDVYTFSTSSFPYVDGSPVGRTHIRINSLPSDGTLKFNGINVIAPQIIAVGDIGLLTYTPNGSTQGAYSVTFDVESSNDNGVTWG